MGKGYYEERKNRKKFKKGNITKVLYCHIVVLLPAELEFGYLQKKKGPERNNFTFSCLFFWVWTTETDEVK